MSQTLHRIGRRKGWFPLVLFPLIMAACAFPGPSQNQVLHTYLLNPEAASTESPTVNGKGMAVLEVNLPRARAGFDTERMVYLRRPQEIGYYAASEWVDPPARMLAPLLVQAFERTSAWRSVVQMPSAIRGDYRIDSENLAIGQEFFQHPSRVRVTLRIQLVDLRQRQILGVKEFEVLEEAPSDDADGGVVAANRAVARLLDEGARWLIGCMQNAPQGDC